MRRAAAVLTLVILGAGSVRAQDKPKDPTKGKADAAQAAGSPLPIGAGVTLVVGKDAKEVSVGLGRDWAGAGINFVQLGLSGTVSDEGEGTVYSSSEKLAPGFKGKVGIGYSSFLAGDYSKWSKNAGGLVQELWCLEILKKVNEGLPTPATLSNDPASCASQLQPVRDALKKSAPAKADDARLAGAVLDALAADVAKPGATPFGRLDACDKFKDAGAKDFVALCGTLPDPEKDGKKHPALYRTYMTGVSLPSTQFKVSANWLPHLLSVPYRTADDLGAKHTWSSLLNSAGVDLSVYHGAFVGGAGVSYGETVDVKLDKVCKNTVQDAYTVQQCKDAMLGVPDPDRAWSFSGALLMYPISQSTTAFVRTGLQIAAKYQLPPKGKGHQSEIEAPFFIVPAAAPFGVSLGFSPRWQWDYTKSKDAIFSIEVFVGVRPDLKQ